MFGKKLIVKQQMGTKKTILAMKKANDKNRKNNFKNREHNKEKIWKLATWNIRSLNGKEQELVQEFNQTKVDIMAICKTKKKGQGVIEMEGGHILFYSGVNEETRAREGVACLIKAEHVNKIKKWDLLNEKIIKLEINLQEKENTIIVVAYGPSEDENAHKKRRILGKYVEGCRKCKGASHNIRGFKQQSRQEGRRNSRRHRSVWGNT